MSSISDVVNNVTGEEKINEMKHKDIVINIDIDNQENEISSKTQNVKNSDKHLKANKVDAKKISLYLSDESLFGYRKSRRERGLSTVWVQFNTQPMPLPDDVEPLDYDPETRNYFVRRVFMIVLIMLIVTFGINIFVWTTKWKNFFRSPGGMIVVICAAVVSIVCSYAMACSMCARRPPGCYVVLVLTTLSFSFILAGVSAKYELKIIMMAILATMGTVMICFALACSKFDFTKYMIYVIVAACALGFLAMIVMIARLIFGVELTPLRIGILVAMTLVQIVMLVMELQMILGGKTVELGEDEYAYGAFLLYTSIINLLLQILQLLGIIMGDEQ